MEISLLKDILSNFSHFSNLSSCVDINTEPYKKYYEKINEILKLVKPTLESVLDTEVASDEQLNKALNEIDGLVNEGRENIESYHTMTSKVYFVIQIESIIARMHTLFLDVFQRLNSLQQYLPFDLTSTSIELCVQKLQGISFEKTSTVIKDAIRDLEENANPSSESLASIADALSLKSNQELLMEAVALEKVKVHTEQVDDGEAEYIDHMIGLVTHMHDLLVKIKQSQSTNSVPIPADFCCPLSLELMTDPVIVASGQTYERTFIKKWLDLGLTVCPKTRQTLGHTNLIPNYTVKALIANWCESNNVKIPDPVRSVGLNQPSALLANTGSGTSTRANYPRSPESIRSAGSPHRGLFSANGTLREGASPSHPRSPSDGGTLGSVTGNGYGLDVGRLSLGSSGEKEANVGDNYMGSGAHTSTPPRIEYSGTNGAPDRFQGHNRDASVSSTVSNMDYFEGTTDVNDVSQVSSDLAHYSSDVSGEVTSEPPTPASSTQNAEREFTNRLADVRSRSQTIWRRPTDRFASRMASSLSSIDTRADLSGLETQVKKLVEDLKSASIDVQRDATHEVRLLAKHNMDNRIVIANCGAISLLVGLLHSPDSKIQENAVTALLNLSINDNNKSAIANAEAINPLIHVLETGSPEAKENSAATLFSLSVIEENKVKIGRSGAIRPLVELLGNGTPRGKKDAATALFNLSIFHENKARIVLAGAVRYLVELMDPAAGMVDKAVAVLSNLATIPEGRSAIGQEGGIPVLVEVVELGSARGKENAAAALLQLCTNSNRFCSMVLQEGAVPPLVALSQSGTPRAKEKAQALLSFFRNQRHGNAGRG